MKLLHGDCLELMKDTPDKSIDMILCDLPYGTTACKWDVVIPFEPLWMQYKRIIKDRGAILPAGHSANGAYWFDAKSGNFITSTYYFNELPQWVNQFNKRQVPDSLSKLGWNKSLQDQEYLQYATADEKIYEAKPFGANQTKLPYDLNKKENEGFSKVVGSHWGNTLTAEMAKAAVIAEELGKDAITDMLAVSFSSPDYVGHSFGPNSWEIEWRI